MRSQRSAVGEFVTVVAVLQAELTKIDELRGNPLNIGSLEEMIDDNHCIVSTTNGPEYYVGIASFVDQDLLEPGCRVLLHSKTNAVVGILGDEVDPMVSVMKVDKAPTETYADIGGLDKQVQEMKVGRARVCVLLVCSCAWRRELRPPAWPLPTQQAADSFLFARCAGGGGAAAVPPRAVR